MKLLVISDSHGHVANIKHVMGFAKKIDAKAVIHCGDWDDVKSLETVLEYNIPLYSVLGNADVNSDLENALYFNCKKFDPRLLEFEVDEKKIGVIHEAKEKNEKLFKYKVVFGGHRHSQEEKMINLTKFIRPGALVNGLNFAVYETITGEVEFFKDEQV